MRIIHPYSQSIDMTHTVPLRARFTKILFLFGILGIILLNSCEQADKPSDSDTPPTDNTGITREDLLSELNTVRTNPKLYATYLEALRPYYKGNRFEEPGEIPVITHEGVAGLNEAVNHLKSMTPVGALVWADGLEKAAIDHVKDTGPKGLFGHNGSDGSSMRDRVERYGTWGGAIGENISYGAKTARRIMIQLLVDDGQPERGHRVNMLNPIYTFVGMNAGYHKEYTVMCVQDFAADYVSKLISFDTRSTVPIL
jgi:uncharacterized protein YkwD